MDNQTQPVGRLLTQEIKELVRVTSLSGSIKAEVVKCLPTASIEKKSRLKLSLLLRLLIEAQKEAITNRLKEKKGLTTMDDLEEMAKEAFCLVRKKEDESISAAEAALIGKSLGSKAGG